MPGKYLQNSKLCNLQLEDWIKLKLIPWKLGKVNCIKNKLSYFWMILSLNCSKPFEMIIQTNAISVKFTQKSPLI